MREIKFRAYDAVLGMCPVVEIDFANRILLVQGKDGGLYSLSIENSPLLEYTGLKDKNGREIYEGGIIKWGEGAEGEVRWIGLNAAFNVMMFSGGWLLFVPPVCEVIGNIYDNPELVKEG